MTTHREWLSSLCDVEYWYRDAVGCFNTYGVLWTPPVFDPDGLVPTLRRVGRDMYHEAAEAARSVDSRLLRLR